MCTPFASFLEVKLQATVTENTWKEFSFVAIVRKFKAVEIRALSMATPTLISCQGQAYMLLKHYLMHAWRVEFLIARECIYKHAYVKWS